MTTRDRTKEFLDKRGSFHHAPRSRTPNNHPGFEIIDSNASVSIEMEDLGPRYLRDGKQIDELLKKIKEKLSQLDQIQKQYALPEIVDRDADAVNILSDEISRLSERAHGRIRKLTGYIENSKSQKEIQLISNLQSKFAKSLQELTITFRKAQKIYFQKISSFDDPDSDAFVLDKNSKDEEENAEFLADLGFTQDQINFTINRINVTEEYAEQARQLLTSMNELNQMFQDISLLVIEQGTMLDRIDHHIETSIVNTDRAIKSLQQAKKSAESTTSKKCILLLCVIIIGVTIVLVVKLVISGALRVLSSTPVIR